MHYLIGVDMGTTNIKAVIFDENGVSRAEARRPTPTQAIGKNGAIYDPEELWRLVSAILREASEKLVCRIEEEMKHHVFGEQRYVLSASIGCTFASLSDLKDLHMAIHEADQKMYALKRTKKG